jgi:hypothetical protein
MPVVLAQDWMDGQTVEPRGAGPDRREGRAPVRWNHIELIEARHIVFGVNDSQMRPFPTLMNVSRRPEYITMPWQYPVPGKEQLRRVRKRQK